MKKYRLGECEQKELARLKEELEVEKELNKANEETIGKRKVELRIAIEELRRLNSGLFNKPQKKILNKLGIF